MTMDDEERELSARLHSAADRLEVPAGLLLRVRESAGQLLGGPVGPGTHPKWLMPALVAAAVVTGCVLFAVTPRSIVVPAGQLPMAPNSAPSSGFVWDRLGHRTATTAPDLSTPTAVVTGYLTAARAGTCSDAAALYWGTPRAAGRRGDLCEDTISDFDVSGHEDPSATVTSDVVAATVTTEGSADGTVPAGKVVWFFQLERQPDGTWRITEGGSGP